MKTIKILIPVAIVALALYAFDKPVQDEWVVPEKYVNMKNPTDKKVKVKAKKSVPAIHSIADLNAFMQNTSRVAGES